MAKQGTDRLPDDAFYYIIHPEHIERYMGKVPEGRSLDNDKKR